MYLQYRLIYGMSFPLLNATLLLTTQVILIFIKMLEIHSFQGQQLSNFLFINLAFIWKVVLKIFSFFCLHSIIFSLRTEMESKQRH